MPAEKLPLSVAIIAKDEEEKLPACLRSIFFADDIVVVDSGSTDRTVDIAKKAGCRVFIEEWKGYGPQKNSATAKCRHEWVLLIDADEQLPAEAVQMIKAVLEKPEADAYSFKRKNYLHGKWLKHSGCWPDRQVRLVNKTKGSFQAVIHERWVTDGIVKALNAHIDHYSFSDYSDMLKTLNDYSTVTAGELFASGRQANALSPFYHGAVMFIKSYFIKLGLLDGLDGLAISLTNAVGSFFKYAKLHELRRRAQK